MNKYYKCRWCSWNTSAYNKKGKHTGHQRLENHVLAAHEIEWLCTQGAESWEQLEAIRRGIEEVEDFEEETRW